MSLKILGPEISDDWSDKTRGCASLDARRRGSGLHPYGVYCQRAGNGGLQWVRVLSPRGWVDTRPNPIAEQDESRQYSAFLVNNDHEVGGVSLPTPVSVRPHI